MLLINAEKHSTKRFLRNNSGTNDDDELDHGDEGYNINDDFNDVSMSDESLQINV